MDIKLNLEPGGDRDISLEGGDLKLVTGLAAIGQDVACRCKTVRGEWILDALNGIPYFELVWVPNPNRMIIDYLFRQTIIQTAGVVAVKNINMDFEILTGKIKIAPTVVADTGEVLVFTDLVLGLT